jgi:hypothetical protein
LKINSYAAFQIFVIVVGFPLWISIIQTEGM